jgi:sugar phosphate isomerase/epimerase
MKLSFSTNAFVRYSLCEAIEQIGASGYRGVELLADTPHLFADKVTPADLEDVAQTLTRTGLEVANINANTAVGYYGREFWEPLFEPSLAHPDPALRQWRVDYTKKCVDFAHFLGCPCVSVTSGKLVPGTAPSASLAFLYASIGQVAAYAEARSVRVGIEYEPGLLVERYEELAELLDRIGSSYVGANLDLGHSHVLGECPEKVIRGLSESIFHIHVEDISRGKHYHLIPGEGDVDFSGLFRLLRKHGYNGFITVELYTYPHQPEVAAQQALRYLQPLLGEHYPNASGRTS